MENLKSNELLIVTDEQFHQIRETYGITKDTIDRDVTSLIDWYNLQPHLPKMDLDREWVERLFVTNKCLMERSKQRLDAIFASRNKIPEFFTNRDPVSMIANLKKSFVICPLKHLNPKDNTRVILSKIVTYDADSWNFEEYFKQLFMINEYRQHNDYCMGDHYILDMENLTMNYYLKMYPTLMRKAEVSNKKVFGSRIAGFHLIHPSPVLDKLVTLMKSALSEKLGGRIVVHRTFEDLHKTIAKEILPPCLGGNDKDCEEIYDDWCNLMKTESFCKWILEQDKLKSDESKRCGELIFDEMLGLPGSFRKLAVD